MGDDDPPTVAGAAADLELSLRTAFTFHLLTRGTDAHE